MEDQNKERKLNINIPQSHVPAFSNQVQTVVTNEEVILQFLYVRPGTQTGNLIAEVAITPQHAIRLQKNLDETLKKHFTRNIK